MEYRDSEAPVAGCSNVQVLELTEEDIPGAALDEPLESHTMPALRWWLLCHGIQAPTSWKKSKLIERLVCFWHTDLQILIREAKSAGDAVIDVDGSYLCRKYQQHANVVLPTPGPPLAGWEAVTEANYHEIASKIPRVTHGLLYTYLAEGVNNTSGNKAFRALQRGFAHWSAGRLDHLEVNYKNPTYCHVRCKMTPSMKPGIYHVYLLLAHDGDFASIQVATCECAAGLSSSCTHVSALLHALVALCPNDFRLPMTNPTTIEPDIDALPITSYACQWKPPRKRKQSSLQISEAKFHKPVYGRERKRRSEPLECFDPRPPEYRNTAKDELNKMLDKIRGKGLCVSLLLDPASQYWQDNTSDGGSSLKPLPPELPTKEELEIRVQEFKESLRIPAHKIREIEQSTREQSLSTLWHSVRRYRVTASYFGEIRRRLPTTPPQSLVLRILGAKHFTSPATEWGKTHEEVALKQYTEHQQMSGHENLYTCRSGFVICEDHPYLGASPDAVVYDPTSADQFGLVEIKCPYAYRHVTPMQASVNTDFCSVLLKRDDGEEQLALRHNHPYYSQVQGQMAITGRSWCDFVIYTEKGLSIERISFECDFWQTELLPKLTDFYDNCLAPEIVSPVHVLGIPVRNLRNM